MRQPGCKEMRFSACRWPSWRQPPPPATEQGHCCKGQHRFITPSALLKIGVNRSTAVRSAGRVPASTNDRIRRACCPPTQLHNLHSVAGTGPADPWQQGSAPLGCLADQHAPIFLECDHGRQRVAIYCGHNDRPPFLQHLRSRGRPYQARQLKLQRHTKSRSTLRTATAELVVPKSMPTTASLSLAACGTHVEYERAGRCTRVYTSTKE